MAIKEQNLLAKDNISMLLYSGSGKGKTHFLCTASEIIESCLVNVERKMTTINKFKGNIKGKVLTIDHYNDLKEILRKINGNETKENYKAFLLDSLTRFQLNSSLDLANERDTNADKLIIDDWNRLNFLINNVMTSLPVDKTHVICTSNATKTEIKINRYESKYVYQPTLLGQLSESIGGWFNTICFIETKYSSKQKSTIRRFHFKATDNFEAKTEFNEFPDFIDNLTFFLLFCVL